MKTLDEVITKMSAMWVCPCSEESAEYCELIDVQTDALQYLKMYKELANDSALFAEWKENPPLSWDELRKKYHRPVWIETTTSKGEGWFLLRGFVDENTAWFFDVRGCEAFGEKIYYGKKWQAYRRERSDHDQTDA